MQSRRSRGSAAARRTIKLGTAIMQMPARTPATTAATVATLDLLSGGRVLLGLGTSGPQVAEGWHGEAFGKPLTRTREYVAIVRAILARARRRSSITASTTTSRTRAPDATGLGKPLKMIAAPAARGRADLPRGDRAEERRARGRDRRRLAADLLLARAVRARRTGRCSRRASRGAAAGPRAGISRPTCPSWSPTTCRPRATSSSRCSRSTSAAWARGARTSTTASRSATATRRRPRRSRTSTSTARRTRRSPRCPTRSSTRSRSSATAPASPTGRRLPRVRRHDARAAGAPAGGDPAARRDRRLT